MLNENGGIEADLTVTCISNNKFRIITGSAVREHDKKHIRKFLNKNVTFKDITDDYSCFGVFGPKSRDLLSKIFADDFTNAQFPFGSGKNLNLNGVPIWFQRLSYVGELGWELYIPINDAKKIYEIIVKEGESFNLTTCWSTCNGYNANGKRLSSLGT